MKCLLFLCIIAILIIIGCFVSNRNTVSEGFISGAEVQLLTSKPYYTWYDYLSNSRRNPYYYGSSYNYRYNPYNYRYNPYNYRYNTYNYRYNPYYQYYSPRFY